jgi:DNA-binding protein H-NS
MQKLNLIAMDFDELWLLHEELTKILAEKITAEKHKLERRLTQLGRQIDNKIALPDQPKDDRPRRRYPKVLPKYANPAAPLETWSGRGKQPRWFTAALRSGQKPDELLISEAEETIGNKGRPDRRP